MIVIRPEGPIFKEKNVSLVPLFKIGTLREAYFTVEAKFWSVIVPSLFPTGLDMEQFPMDLGEDVTHHSSGGVASSSDEVELMDVDTDWLEKFISDDPILSPPPHALPSNHNSLLGNQSVLNNGVLSNEYDPLLSNNSSFWNELVLGSNSDLNTGTDLKMLNDQELLCGWDRIDYAS